MTPATDPFMAGVRPSGLQRGRGGFLRSADDAPWVTDPTGELCKTGERKGEVKRLKYGSPSNRGREIENDAGLVKYKQRLSLAGIGMDPSLAEACKALADLPVGSPEFNSAADAIVVAADKLTRSELAADRGTHGHALTEANDRGVAGVIAKLYREGEQFGLDEKTQREVIIAWQGLVYTNALEVLAIEASCVDDTWRLAGTLDRIVRTTRPLTFAKSTGELAVIPANTVIVLDIKFGKCRKAHPIQIASYAQSVPYDTETETRGEWLFEIDQTHALIAHGDFGDDTRPPSIDLVWVDLVAGREHGGETVVQAKAWAARDDVFSVAMLNTDEPLTEVGEGAPGYFGTAADMIVEGAEINAVDPSAAAGEGVADSSPPPSPALDDGDPCIDGSCPSCWDDGPSPARLALVQARDTLATAPDEGTDLSGAEHGEQWAALQRHYGDLDAAAKSWLAELIGEATRRGVDFHARRNKTLRVFELYRALIALCAADGGTDELLRALLALVIGDVALFPGVAVGHAVGSLSAAEATQLAEWVDQFNGPGLAAWIDADQIFRLREVSPA